MAETQVWDGSGWQVAATVPISETDYLYRGDWLERNLNLYFTGDGRFYDPWLGKYIQPDPIGGPPLLPQAADRYQYAGNSPTGVGAESQGSALVLFGWIDLRDVAVDSGAFVTGKAWEALAGARWGYGSLSGSLEVVANRAWAGRVQKALGQNVFREVSRRGRNTVYRSRVYALGGGRYKGIGTGAEFTEEFLERQSGWPVSATFTDLSSWFRRGLNAERTPWLAGRLPGRLGSAIEEIGGIKAFKASELVGGTLIGFGFDAGWQLLQDAGNPYLTPRQKVERAFVVGGTGAVAGVAVMLVVGTGPAGFCAALVVGWTAERKFNEWVFETYPRFSPTMNLSPLQP